MNRNEEGGRTRRTNNVKTIYGVFSFETVKKEGLFIKTCIKLSMSRNPIHAANSQYYNANFLTPFQD